MDIGEVGDPELVKASQSHTPCQVYVHLAVVPGIRGQHKLAEPHRQQVVGPQHSQHTFVVNSHAAAVQFGRHPPVAVTAMVRQYDLLNGCPQGHFRLVRFALHQVPVIARPAHAGQIAHPLHRQIALLLRPRSDGGIDAEAPIAVLCWRPCLTLSKALLKKSFSSVFSARAAFSRAISSRCAFSLRSSAVVPRLACRGSGRPSNWYFQVYRSFRSNFSSRAKAPTFSQVFICSTTCRLNSTLCRRHFRFLAIWPPFAVKVRLFSVSHFWGSLHKWELHPGRLTRFSSYLSTMRHAPVAYLLRARYGMRVGSRCAGGANEGDRPRARGGMLALPCWGRLEAGRQA